MSRPYYEGPEETEEVEEIEDEVVEDLEAEEVEEEVEEVEEEEVVEENTEFDPEFLEWAKTQDLKTVRKNHERFTQQAQELASQRKELEPALELVQSLQEDPELVSYLSEYYERKERGETIDPSAHSKRVEQELLSFKNQIATERELERLHTMASNDKLPDFDDGELLEFATQNRVGSLEVAYKAMHADAIAAAKVAAKEAEIKANAKAKVETRQKPAEPTGSTLDQLMAMSDEEFIRATRK